MPSTRLRRIAARVGVATPTFLAAADPAASQILAVNDLQTVIGNLQGWIISILAAVATLFLVIGFARYMTAGGDPGETERAKGAFKAAAIGYAGALLAPFFMGVLQQILGV
jgi:hypothetical protein